MKSVSRADPPLLMERLPKYTSVLLRVVYEWFLELPVPVVLAVIWLVGAALIGLCGAALYFLWVLLQALAEG